MAMLPFNIATLMYARFIIRNRLGTAWGDNGFAYAPPAYITGGFFNESYGVTV